MFTHVFLVATVSSSNKAYQTFITKSAIKVAVIPEVFDTSFLIYHVCFNSLHHLSNFKALFSSKDRLCTFSDATELSCRTHQQQTHASEWTLNASTQDIALGQPQPQWAYIIPVKLRQVAVASDKHTGLKMFLRLTPHCVSRLYYICTVSMLKYRLHSVIWHPNCASTH